MRFYLNSSILIDGELDIEILDFIISEYVKRNPLNDYDYKHIFDLNYLYMIEALSVYDRLLMYNTDKFHKRAQKRIHLLDCIYSAREELERLGEKYA